MFPVLACKFPRRGLLYPHKTSPTPEPVWMFPWPISTGGSELGSLDGEGCGGEAFLAPGTAWASPWPTPPGGSELGARVGKGVY